MDLNIDAGNTRVKWILNADALVVARGACDTAGWLGSGCDFGLLGLPSGVLFNKIRVSSVLGGAARAQICESARSSFGVEVQFAVVRPDGLVRPAYKDLSSMGVDRWLAMLAAYQDALAACVVIDAGSAVTLDVVDSKGDHKGGYIVPGFASLERALLGSTRDVSVGLIDLSSELSLGCSTEACVSLGVSLMFRSFFGKAIEGLVSELEAEVLKVYVTGGDAQSVEKICAEMMNIELCVKKDLVFDGLMLSFG